MVEYVQSDIITRALKLDGQNVVHVCADDTHGTPIEINARDAGEDPKDFIKRWHEAHKQTFEAFDVDFDNYGITDSDENKELVEHIYQKLVDADMIYEKEIEQAYDEQEERFLPDRYVKGECPNCGASDQYGDQCESCGTTYRPVDLVNPKSTLSGEPPITKQTTHYFFKLSEMEDDLRDFIQTANIQDSVRNQIMNWIDDGLDDWCISRDKPYFGFQIPDSDKYFYVWLDAPVGYLASLADYLGNTDKAIETWNNAEITHFIGKDIIYFHLLFWPAVLKTAGLNVPDTIFAHGFMNVNGKKMSKSRGTYFTADEWADLTEPEFLRFYLAHNLNDKVEDINLDMEHFQEVINNELVSNIANLVYRTLNFINEYLDGSIGENVDRDIKSILSRRQQDVIDHYKNHNLRKATQMLLHVSSEGNTYFQDKRPWITAKTDKDDCRETLTTCANLVKNIAILLKPIMPRYAKEIEKQLNLSGLDFSDINFDLHNHEIGESEIIYEKIDELQIQRDKHQDFGILNLKVGEVTNVEDHPNADKLLLLTVNLGDETRQIIAGLKEHYEEEELEEKKVIVVTNMEPAELRGETSEGMILAADGIDEEEEDAIGILFVQETPIGSQVTISGVEPSTETINFNQFKKLEITTEEGRVHFHDKMLRTHREYVKVERVHEGTVR
jgi:methionyl-tRNA synthetase